MKEITIVLGPTAVGKSELAVELALQYSCPVISCDSRQIYKEMSIGTAVPGPELLTAVHHYFIHSHSVTEYYTAGKYEIEANRLAEELFKEHDRLVMVGGSGFYIDAFCNGLDDFPPADQELHRHLSERLKNEGVAALRRELKSLDPVSYNSIDIANGQRVVRALEVCIMTGKPFSSFKKAVQRKRNFSIRKLGLTRPREILYERIDRRVIGMVDAGLVDEVKGLAEYRDLSALKTVGYSEIFRYLDGEISLDEAIRLVQRNTRHYAKRQMTYWGRDKEIMWKEL